MPLHYYDFITPKSSGNAAIGKAVALGLLFLLVALGAGLLQAGPPLWYGGLAVHAHHLCGGCAQRCDQQAVPADAGSGGSCHGG